MKNNKKHFEWQYKYATHTHGNMETLWNKCCERNGTVWWVWLQHIWRFVLHRDSRICRNVVAFDWLNLALTLDAAKQQNNKSIFVNCNAKFVYCTVVTTTKLMSYSLFCKRFWWFYFTEASKIQTCHEFCAVTIIVRFEHCYHCNGAKSKSIVFQVFRRRKNCQRLQVLKQFINQLTCKVM